MSIEYKFIVGVGLSNCNQEEVISVEELGYSDDEWSKFSDGDRSEILQEFCNGWVFEYIDAGWEEVE
jgi:hypothetical protein